jgi:N-acetylmuramate 1-kinase
MRIILPQGAREFLDATSWKTASCQPLAGDASTRKYFRLRQGEQSAILMDASQNRESFAPFVRIDQHLRQLGFSVPAILALDEAKGFMVLEDFGETVFARLLERLPDSRYGCGDPEPCSRGRESALISVPGKWRGLTSAATRSVAYEPDPEKLFTLATDVLIALHQHPKAIPEGLREYSPQRMLADMEVFLEGTGEPPVQPGTDNPAISEKGAAEFRAAWSEVLPLAHRVPKSLLLRDYHVANLMLLPERSGIWQAGLLDFQDAYQGPMAYDLMSLLEDARRDVPEELKQKMLARYLAQFPALDRGAFATSTAILAAVRHTRVLGIFARLSRREGKHDYQRLHSPRVRRLLEKALAHPALAGVQAWFDRYAR